MQTVDMIIEKFDEQIKGFAFSIAKDRDLADDIVQDTYLKIINNQLLLARLKPSQIRSWLFKVIKNLLINKKRERVFVAFAEVYEPVVEPQFEKKWLIRTMISHLSDEEQLLIKQKYWLGRNSSEIARALDMPKSTVRWKLSGAIKKLRNLADLD